MICNLKFSKLFLFNFNSSTKSNDKQLNKHGMYVCFTIGHIIENKQFVFNYVCIYMYHSKKHLKIFITQCELTLKYSNYFKVIGNEIKAFECDAISLTLENNPLIDKYCTIKWAWSRFWLNFIFEFLWFTILQ